MKRDIILETICFLLALLFLYTGSMKLLTYRSFVWDLGRDPMIGPKLANSIGIVLPIIELAVAAFILIPTKRKWGLYASATLMLLFTIYVGWMIKDPTRHCTCGGIIRAMTWQQHLWFNIGFTILAIIGAYLFGQKTKLEMWQKSDQSPDMRYNLSKAVATDRLRSS